MTITCSFAPNSHQVCARHRGLVYALALVLVPACYPADIALSGSSSGQTFEGVGAVFANGMVRLLKDYPPNQRQDILALLFQKNFGAGFQHVKIEIGSDANTSAGTEPSHMRSSTDLDITRGTNLWLAQQAKAINSSIRLDTLRWGMPAWVQSSTDKYTFYKNYLQQASTTFGLSFDYLGADQNEGSFDRDWVVNTLRPNLNSDGFSSVKLTAADQVGSGAWDIATQIGSDAGLLGALGALTAHYTEDSTADAKTAQSTYGKPIWAGEDLAPTRNGFVYTIDTAHRIVKSYALGRMTKYEMDPGVEASYPVMPFGYKSILVAQWPWSGHYEVTPGLWAVAHFTQFAQPGWRYLDSACASGNDGGYVALRDSASSNWSMIFVNYSPAPVTHTVTRHPTADWIVQQLREAFPEASPYRYVVLDHDSKFDGRVINFLNATGLKPKQTSIRSPWQNGTAERWVGSARRECFDHVIALCEAQVRRIAREYISYYHHDRTHDSLEKDTPKSRTVEQKPSPNSILISNARLGGIHHRYSWRAAA